MRRGLGILLVCALLSGAALASAAPVLGATQYPVALTGDAVAPGPGDADATGSAIIVLDAPSGLACIGLDLAGATGVTSITIHPGAAGATGAAIVTLPMPPNLSGDTECSPGHDQESLAAVVADPAGHYLQVATEEFPDGAVRGQLTVREITRANAAKVACPPGVDEPGDVGGDLSKVCRIVVAGDEPLDPPAGYTWEVPPLGFPGMSITLEDSLGVRTLDDADRDGGGLCDPATFTCIFGRSYSWQEVVVGPTTITEATHPEGYRLGWVVVRSGEGGQAPAYDLDLASGSVTFDSSGFPDGVSVTFVDIVVPTSTPPPSSTPAPTSSAGRSATPRVTLPPTSTAAGSIGSGESSAVGIALALGMLGGIALLTARVLRRRPATALEHTPSTSRKQTRL